jgi:hypothetical protein
MQTQPLKPQPQASSAPANPVNFVTVAFFRPKGWYTTLVAGLQWLLGYSFNAPTHVGIHFRGNLYEMTAAGTECREVTFAALQQVASHTSYFFCSDDEIEALEDELGQALLQDWYLDLWGCICYCFKVLVLHHNRHIRLFAPAPYGSVEPIPSSHSLIYAPPSSCTCFVWNNLDNIIHRWDIFSPASLFKALTGETYK